MKASGRPDNLSAILLFSRILPLPTVLQQPQHRVQLLGHQAPSSTAGFVMANGSLSSNQPGEGDNRENSIEADLVQCIVALPG